MSDSTTRTRAPRGTKTVADAFFAALKAIPEARQNEVARAAQIAIRDEMKALRDKTKAAATKEKQRKTAEAPAPRRKLARVKAVVKAPVRAKAKAKAKAPAAATPARRATRRVAARSKA